MNVDDQSDLFSSGQDLWSGGPVLSADTSLQAALGAFEKYMESEGFALNTRKAFASDIRLLGQYLGIGQPVGLIGTKNLNDFLNWLLNERGVSCSQKSYARRVTTLKSFFSWLHRFGILPDDPSAALIQVSVSSPLPELPTEAELQRALAVTSALRQGTADSKPDARPHLLLTLLLDTGIKKSEAVALVLNHIDRQDPEEPFLFIRIKNPRLRWKERKIALQPAWLDILDEYLTQYEPDDTLFTCTARNLEYILSDVGDAAGLPQGRLSFENLRWTSALREHRQTDDPGVIRQRLGLSPITWRETRDKLDRLLARQQSIT
jgi:site-specific recombinase XerD